MKPIIKLTLLLTVFSVGLIGCQKQSDEIDVSLKSAGALTIIDAWTSGNAAFECAQAGGECGFAFKIDEWSEDFGMDGDYPVNGNTITITESNSYTFDWTSEYPVCKVIVKAGRGAYVYSYPNGAYHDEGLIGYKGKGISHVTFCYAERPELVIAIKSLYFDGISYGYAVSSGTTYFSTGWCGDWELGVNDYPQTTAFSMISTGGATIGNVMVENSDVSITLNEGLFLVRSYLYVGTLDALLHENLVEECPRYNTSPWLINTLYGNSQTFSF